MRLLVLSLLLAAVAVSGRLTAESADFDFDIQGLELLQQRYGSAYPGFAGLGAGKVDLNQQAMLGNVGLEGMNMPWQYGNIGQQQFGLGMQGDMDDNIGQQQFGWAGMQGVVPQQQLQGMLGNAGNIGGFGDIGSFGNVGMQLGSGLMPASPLSLGQYQAQLSTATMANPIMSSSFGNVGSFGSVGLGSSLGLGSGFGGLGAGMGSKKGQTTVAQPIYAESLIVPKVITQPILRPHMVTQPIVQQQLIQQPIVETRQVIQPVVRRIITQPIIKPQILESTTIQPTLKTETTVQPHLIQQTVVTPQLQNLAMENQPIQEKATTQMQQAVIQPTQSGKKSSFAARTF